MARTLSDAMLMAWLEGGQKIVAQVPASSPLVPPYGLAQAFPLPAQEGELVVEFPQLEVAVKSLAEKRVLTRDKFDQLDYQAKRAAFTVARLGTEDAIEKVQAVLVEDIRRGGTLAEFRENVDKALGESALSEGHVENIYRTNIGQSYKQGQQDILAHPLVAPLFPYVMYVGINDSRRRETHKWFATGGINGTNIYRTDDPVIRKFWAPWDFSCRCGMVLLSLRDAAARGIREAQQWLASDVPPANPTYVEHPPFDLPPGWTSNAPVSLSVQHAY